MRKGVVSDEMRQGVENKCIDMKIRKQMNLSK